MYKKNSLWILLKRKKPKNDGRWILEKVKIFLLYLVFTSMKSWSNCATGSHKVVGLSLNLEIIVTR